MDNNSPNFLCVGAQKAGTTSFSDILREHPDVFVPALKELHYFDQEGYKQEGIDKYLHYFKGAEEYKIRAEFTPVYLYFDEVPERILKALGKDVKILIILRHPVDRAFSQYQMNLKKGYEVLSFTEAFHQEKERLQKDDFSRRECSYFDRGFYAPQVKRYMECFSNVKVVLFDDFIKNNDGTMSEIYEFCEIENCCIPLPESNKSISVKNKKLNYFIRAISINAKTIALLKKSKCLKKIKKKILASNTSSQKDSIDLTFAKRLQEYYHSDICELESLLNMDLSTWKNKYI